MSENGPGKRRSSPDSSPAEAGGPSGDNRPLPWLLRQKISIPDRVAGHLNRVGIEDRVMPTRRRLTVLNAPGGFGKTTLLAECSRHLRDDGIPVAWISVDEQDEPEVLDTYIAFACQSAVAGTSDGQESPATLDHGEALSGTESRTAFAMREVASLELPFVLVFDELERLPDPDSAALLDFLLKRGPANLHLAFACRQLPSGVDIASALLEGRAAMVSAEELRFSRTEAAEFFDRKLSRARLDTLMAESAGWPFALRISRNELDSGGRGDARAAQEIVENWVESRLFPGLGAEERDFLLDIGLFEWMDAALLDEVLERNDSLLRIKTMSVLVGMLEPVQSEGTDVWRLHPLIREHCLRRRFRETPERFRAIHRRIAHALARRGQTASAMRHAVDAGEPALAGDILERAGGVRLHASEGSVEFQAADAQLTEDVIQGRPRLGLVRCLSLLLSGRTEEAKERFRSLAPSLDANGADGGDAALDLSVERCTVRGVIALYGGERLGGELLQSHLVEVARLAESPRVDRVTRGIMEFSLAMAGTMSANFEATLNRCARARQYFAQSRYMLAFIDLQEGQVAMARGRVREAAALYRRAEQVAKARYWVGPEPATLCRTLLGELALETGRTAADAELTDMPETLLTGSSPFQAFTAASGAVIDYKLRDEGVERALAVAGEMLDYVRGAALPALVRYVAGLKVSLLATAGRIAEGEQAWASDDLPESTAECLDLESQTWREMEALSCARLRLLIGQARFEDARDFAAELCAGAAERGLTRTVMRALVLSMVLEVAAGDAAAATKHLESYLRVFAKTPYTGPLVREREACTPLVSKFLAVNPDATRKETARLLFEAMERASEPPLPALTVREREVLERLETQGDKQIAEALGLSVHGVRYHLRNLFEKLGARTRGEAVRRARERGVSAGES
ncbi:MAG: LuxR C-terminal-related transcriptional regulator [Immundisolibacterales bacterium]|nr:LuxR C-terminal-related transcriptional regulator [Immundisolibacterales bacterium]